MKSSLPKRIAENAAVALYLVGFLLVFIETAWIFLWWFRLVPVPAPPF